jgi:hypothetical protein
MKAGCFLEPLPLHPRVFDTLEVSEEKPTSRFSLNTPVCTVDTAESEINMRSYTTLLNKFINYYYLNFCRDSHTFVVAILYACRTLRHVEMCAGVHVRSHPQEFLLRFVVCYDIGFYITICCVLFVTVTS